ncbi:hypothetical protein [Haloferula sp. BvORR071]|uniref:hypothetical protein n=1 Tax=Haloferula sp. BvORR071 TaxID=1396141 RepID=UPI002240F799|nr:hypothetical protein [Haloferula sp. BvORR071]
MPSRRRRDDRIPPPRSYQTRRARALPTLVPFDASKVRSERDPWTVRSLKDLGRVYLPEVSMTAGLAILCGVLAGEIYGKLVVDCGPFVFPAIYAGILLLSLSSICLQARAYPAALTRARIRGTLLGALLIFGVHLVGFLAVRTLGIH